MSLFTPLTGLLGGSLLGASASTLLLVNGDIMGISGIISTAYLNPFKSIITPSSHWKLVFLGSFFLTVNFYVNHVEGALRDPRMETSRDYPVPSTLAYALGGLLSGLGTKLGNGCTTGHGICGLGRFSRRSLAAVLTFTACGMMTTFVLGPERSWSSWTGMFRTSIVPAVSRALGTVVTACGLGAALIRHSSSSHNHQNNNSSGPAPANGTSPRPDETVHDRKVMGAAASGALCALGLAISGMTKASKVHDFLDLCALCKTHGHFDPTLVAVLGSAVLTSVVSYQFVQGYNWFFKSETLVIKKPICSEEWCVPTNKTIDSQLVAGAVLFGVGWGLVGLCPGPALYDAAAGVVPVVIYWFPMFLAGAYTSNQVKAYLETRAKSNKASKSN